jgi:hypothetical protein
VSHHSNDLSAFAVHHIFEFSKPALLVISIRTGHNRTNDLPVSHAMVNPAAVEKRKGMAKDIVRSAVLENKIDGCDGLKRILRAEAEAMENPGFFDPFSDADLIDMLTDALDYLKRNQSTSENARSQPSHETPEITRQPDMTNRANLPTPPQSESDGVEKIQDAAEGDVKDNEDLPTYNDEVGHNILKLHI